MRQAKLLTIFPLFIAWANGYSVLQGKTLNGGDNSYLEIERLAKPVLQKHGASLKRQDSIGSWSLRAVKCPENTQQCDMGFPAMEVCCPKNFVCVYSLFKIACCATESSCIETAATFPKCADPSWTLWAGSREDFFCCEAGQIGYVTTDNSAACGPDTIKPTGKQVATLVQNGDNSSPQTSVPSSSDDNGTSSSPLPDPSTSVDSSSSSSSSDYPTVTNNPIGTDDDPTGTPGNQDTDNDGSGSKQSSDSSSSGLSSSSSSSGLSTGAIAGIAAGGVLLLILAGVAVFFALRAGKKKGAAQAMAAFQQQQRSLPGPGHSPGGPDNLHANPEYYQSGPGTPRGGAFATGNQGYGQEVEVKPQLVPGVADQYGQGVQVPPAPVSSPPPQQWSPPPQESQGHPTYEADSTTAYQNSRYEMEGYNNQQRF